VTTSSAAGRSLLVLFPAADSTDMPTVLEAYSRVRSGHERVPLVFALVGDSVQLDVLADVGVDDFLFWPSEAELLRRRLDLCRTRVARRERDFIRAQKLAEAVRAAERSEQRFRHLAESSTEILTRCSPGGVRLYVSPACRTVLEYEPDELLGSTMLDILHPADTSKLVDALELLDAGAEVAITIIRLQRKEGDYAWLEMICRPVRDPRTGAIEEIVTVSRDITTLVHIEHDKLENEGQFEAFASRAPVGIFKVDVHGNCVFINPRACELLGATAENAAGHGWMSFLQALPWNAFFRPLHAAGGGRVC
jgi:PAS domain S-box-containing protein